MNIGNKIGQSIGQSAGRAITNSAYVINDISSVHNLREAIYQRKAEIAKSDLVKEIFTILFADETHPPREILVNVHAVSARRYEADKNSYQIYSEPVVHPEHPFDYPTACALFLLIQDKYKNVYDFPSVTMTQLQPAIQSGTWQTTLQMKAPFIGKALTPAYTVSDLEFKALDDLPLEFKDPKGKGVQKLPIFALIVGILSILLSATPFGFIFAAAGIIMGAIGMKTKNMHKLSLIAILISVAGIVLPIIRAISNLLSIF